MSLDKCIRCGRTVPLRDNIALKPSFARYVRLGGVRATLMARLRLAFAALTGRSASAALRPARAHSPGLSFLVFSTLTNAA